MRGSEALAELQSRRAELEETTGSGGPWMVINVVYKCLLLWTFSNLANFLLLFTSHDLAILSP